jgi:peroxiredoxin
MASAYQLLDIRPDATREELDAAYAHKRAAYAPEHIANLPDEIQAVAAQRRADLAAAYQTLRIALATPAKLDAATEKRRDRESIAALLVLVSLALLIVLVRPIAVPERTVTASGSDAAALTAQTAPDFTLPTVDGKEIRLSDLRGKVVLINFWATWCPPCVREIPRLVRVSEKYRDQGLVILGINVTAQDDRAKVEQFVRDQRITYPVLLDLNSDAGQKYSSRLMPTTYFIDRTGKIVHTKVGEVDEATIEEQIQALLQAESANP